MAKSHRSFSPEFKAEALRRLSTGAQPLTQLAREIGVHPSLLQVWRRKASEGFGAEAVAQAQGGTAMEDELRRLRRENAELREDREILKKAAAFFAKESR